jgi:hypothetical protein
MDNSDREQRIRECAFQIWIDEGQPEGREKDNWQQAEAELVSSPALQPDQQGNMPQEQKQTTDAQPQPQGGTNPDDVAR